MGDKGGAKKETLTNEPWEKAQPMIIDFLERAMTQSNVPLEQFPGQRVNARAAESERAFADIEGLEGTSPVGEMNTFLQSVLRGDFQGEQGRNPLLDETFGVMSKRIGEQFNQIVMPTVNSRFAGSGRSGSGAAGRARGRADETLARELGDLGTQIYYGDYERAMGDRFSAASLAPAGQSAELARIGALGGVGANREQYSQRLLNDSIERFNFSQTEPESRLDRYGARVNNASRGYGSQEQLLPSGDGGTGLGLGILGIIAQLAAA